MALEEAIELSGRNSVWLRCGESGRGGAQLLVSAIAGLRAAVPGLADVARERLAAGHERIDVLAATEALLGELERLLVDPMVIVFDDAEELEGADTGLALVDQLLNSRGVPLSVAIATRRSLPLKLAKLRAGGQLTEVGRAQLSFTPAECEELLRLRHGPVVTPAEVEAAVAASEGWPMGVALAGLAGASAGMNGATSQAELFSYLAEEVLDRLDEETRIALVDSSLPATLTESVADAIGLPPGFLDSAERRGLFLRRLRSGARVYHPLFRALLLERLEALRSESERADLHARVAASLAASGQETDAIEHWLSARRYPEALAAIDAHRRYLLRTAPGTVAEWAARLPASLHKEPAYLLLEAQLLWGDGRHEQALESLRAATAGYRRGGDARGEWLTRIYLADALVSVGAFEEVSEHARDWDGVSARAAGDIAAGVAWYQVIALAGRGRPDDAEALARVLRADVRSAAQFRYLDDMAMVGIEPAAGRGRDTLERLHATIAELEVEDPHGRLPYAQSMVILVLRDLGEREAAFEMLDACQLESEQVGMGFVARDCHLQRALLLAQDGDLARAELELAAAGPRQGTGWRGTHRPQAEAQVASLRGETAKAIAVAEEALDRVAPGALCYRVWTAIEMAPLLASNGAPERARRVIDATLEALDQRLTGDQGRYHRARLLATRACLEHDVGELDHACASLSACWVTAGQSAPDLVRAHWPRLRPVLWQALELGAVAPDTVLPALQGAFSGGEALVALVDHCNATIRRAALSTALTAGHPAVVERLGELSKDSDEVVASAAAATRERLRTRPPSLRFELLGGFKVRRAGWELDDAVWGRPMAARVVRFLLVQGGGAVPEDVLFDAFWSDRPADAARQHLAVAVSRARKVLDLPGAEQSVIDGHERTYRLRLRTCDTVDVAEFEQTASAALAADGRDRSAALERAAAQWAGEPLPEDRYAPWSFAWRERVVELYSQVLSALVESHESAGDHEGAIRAAQRLLEVDHLNERAHRWLMLAYARTGRASHALRQYLECRRALVVDLGVEPTAETSAIQARILAGEPV